MPILSAMAAAAIAQASLADLSAVEIFALAAAAERGGRYADAEALYRALARDPDLEIRSEARFRLGVMLSARTRHADAALVFRELLDEKPGAQRVRLELARVLALIGDEAAARRELRAAQAGGLPPNVAAVVDQFTDALRSRRPYGASISIALAPDSNINRATDAQTLDTIIAPLDLSEDARERSGVGLKVGAQAFARLRLAPRLSLLPRLSGQSELYREKRFNDVSGSVGLGLELVSGADRIRPSAGATWRYYGGDLYARTQNVSVGWSHPLGRVAQLDTDVSVSRARYLQNPLQNGWIYDLGASYQRAFDARSGGTLSLSATRQSAEDAGYSTTSGGATLLGYREFGRTTAFASAGVRRLVGDERLFLFPEKRREWLLSASLGATFRAATVAGFAPLVRLSFERNASSVGIYDYTRRSAEFGITRAF
ncbi:MAG TPA: surface lipoprotein assembly modifier [Sphingomonadaceae bacterium]|nr:surface lipoprotein assembly modifier [Sphingomonadaceae bacterium]